MQNKESALRQIDEIYAILNNNIKTVMSGPLMIAIGLGIMAIPLIELIFSKSLDSYLLTLATLSYPIAFIIRTIFYWSLFYGITRYFGSQRKHSEVIERVFAVGKFLPFIGVSLGATLAITGFTDIIAPFILILVGCFFLFYGQFTGRIVQITALALISGGFAGILLTIYHIPNLWMYLVAYQGLVFVLMGLTLKKPTAHID